MTVRVWRLLLIVTGLLLGPVTLAAQNTTPPSGSTTGPAAIEGAIYHGVHTIIVKTVDGVEHVFRFMKDLVVLGKKPGIDTLEGLREGSTVVVHYTTESGEPIAREIDPVGDQGLAVTEGTITRIDRGRTRITVRIGSGRTETFELTDRVVAEARKDIESAAATGGAKVVIYYTDQNGHKVVHYFKKV